MYLDIYIYRPSDSGDVRAVEVQFAQLGRDLSHRIIRGDCVDFDGGHIITLVYVRDGPPTI